MKTIKKMISAIFIFTLMAVILTSCRKNIPDKDINENSTGNHTYYDANTQKKSSDVNPTERNMTDENTTDITDTPNDAPILDGAVGDAADKTGDIIKDGANGIAGGVKDLADGTDNAINNLTDGTNTPNNTILTK